MNPPSASSPGTRIWSALVTVAQVAVVVAAVLTLAAPGSPLRAWWAREAAARRAARMVEARWAKLTQGARLDDNPAVTVVEFGDYECPFCRVQHRILMDLARERSEVSVAYHQLPLPSVHPQAAGAAAAAICAEAQGAFRSVHEHLFATSEWQVEGDWAQVARAGGVPDVERFLRCLDSADTEERIAATGRLAQELGIRGTPTFVFSNGLVWEGSMQPEEILAQVAR